MLRQKKTNHFYAQNNILQKVREYPLKIARVLVILYTKIKYIFATYKLNVYKRSAK